jgi:hypothetical protein
VCSVYDVNESEKNEENKEKKHLLSRVASLLKGKQKNSLFRVLQQGCSFSHFSRSLFQQLYGNSFGSKRQ